MLRCCAGGGDGSPLLKTFAAIHRAPLCGLERNRGFLTALRADRLGFDALNASRTRAVALSAAGFARFAPLGLVLKALVGEKHLLAAGENELRTTLGTLQDLVMVFHALLRDLAGRGQAAAQFTPDDDRDTRKVAAVPLSRLARNCLKGPK